MLCWRAFLAFGCYSICVMGLIRLRAELRAIRDAIEELRTAIDNHSETVHAAEESRSKDYAIPKRLQVLVSHDEEIKEGEHKSYTAQENIKKWTKRAVIAASTYAFIAALQYWEMRIQTKQVAKQFEAQQRPWVDGGEIEFRQPVFLVYPDNPIQARTQVDVVVEIPTKNVGAAPALHVDAELSGTMTKEIAGPKTMDTMMEYACHLADGNSKQGGGALFPNSTPTKVEYPINIMVPFIEVTEIRRVWITICIAYSNTGSADQLHHTKIWAASWPIDGQPKEIRRTANPAIIYYTLPIAQWGIVKTQAD
jgi:hypothetical protein